MYRSIHIVTDRLSPQQSATLRDAYRTFGERMSRLSLPVACTSPTGLREYSIQAPQSNGTMCAEDAMLCAKQIQQTIGGGQWTLFVVGKPLTERVGDGQAIRYEMGLPGTKYGALTIPEHLQHGVAWGRYAIMHLAGHMFGLEDQAAKAEPPSAMQVVPLTARSGVLHPGDLSFSYLGQEIERIRQVLG